MSMQYKYSNLQVGDNDLIGNKFNGHDLHLYLRKRGINSSHLVWNKESKDKTTYLIAGEKKDRKNIKDFTLYIQNKYSLNGINNPLFYDILYDKLFLETDVLHLHLIHNYIIDLNLLPIISRLKPTVWTIHDLWPLGGHCVYHFDCNKWKHNCSDCPYLSTHFSMQSDNSALNFAIKKDAIKRSKIEIIVASRWMENKVINSPLFKHFNVNFIPFGINQNIFKPINKLDARKKLGIKNDCIVISFRCDGSEFKGLDYIKHALKNLKTNKNIQILVFGKSFGAIKKWTKYPVKEFGWVKNDFLMSQIYNASDIFLMPSTMEAFGMMAIEAMSCKTLPIVLNGTSLPEVVNAPECGVSTIRNKSAFTKTVEFYIENEDERNRRSELCCNFAKNNYSKDTYIDKIDSLYKKVIKNHNLTNEDELILEQLKKHMMVKKHYSNQPASFDGIRNPIMRMLILLFFKIDKIVPKKFRVFIKTILNKVLKR